MTSNNFSTGGKPSNAEIVARDTALRAEQEQKRLSLMTPEQREREKLHFAAKRRAAVAAYDAIPPRNLTFAPQVQ